jgi:uridylate kinase
MDAPGRRRVLLKLSGEALMGGGQYGVSPEVVRRIAEEIIEVHAANIEVAVVIGGGNIFRGVTGMPPTAWTGCRPTTWACWPP